ncbi:uncharacterized protein LOC122535445 isoform X3 [Frieseomelitta varia]|uniref:uncharacterized protein LOC122535445 isoform X3 n=1 Tax=Frieseomelitta varia TaxID=561572 RepID=UPI001CB697B9|nr:uncharacterized protein LOC122535445 isoform X3 [Frieseomelitta varia]
MIGSKMSVEVRAGRPTMPTISQSKRPTILVYPTVTPESIIIPIVSCILGFPLLALMVICCLRRRAKLARERARRRNCDLDHGALSLVRFSPVHRLAPAICLTAAIPLWPLFYPKSLNTYVYVPVYSNIHLHTIT